MEKLISFLKSISPKTWIIIAIVLVIIIAIIIYVKNKNKESTEKLNKIGGNLPDNLNNSTPRSIFPLVYGSRGEEVKSLQRYLKSKGQNIGNTGPALDGVDGVWGPKTDAAVMAVFKKTSISESEFKSLV